jgi:hypothetical protein
MNAEAYLQTLPEVDTVRLPKGTLFVANRLIYHVIEAGNGGFSRARQWRREESTDVALVPNSFLTRTLPLVAKGRILPVYRSRTELTEGGSPRGFIFPSEALAKDAAYLDTSLIISAGAYVRNHEQAPGYAATDGVQIFRLYYFMKSDHGRSTHIAGNFTENPRVELRPHTEGPAYWRLLPSWQENFPASKVTQQSMPVVKSLDQMLHEADKTRHHGADVTQVNRAVRPQDLAPDVSDVTQPTRIPRISKPIDDTQAGEGNPS